jgi:DNA-binding FadR family transcriptional regulator
MSYNLRMMSADSFLLERRRPRSLALGVVEELADRIRDGRLPPGAKLATEAALMGEFGVSRTVIREALSKMQASSLVETRHGVGTFVSGRGDSPVFRIRSDQLATLRDVVAMLELRIGVETEAAGLAAQRRSDRNLDSMRQALHAFTQAVERGNDAVGADFRVHLEIARATQNAHFENLVQTFGTAIIPRARLDPSAASPDERQAYLRRVNAEHGSILDAVALRDSEAARAAMRTHLANSRERRRRAGQL